MKCAVAVLRASARTAVRLAAPCTGVRAVVGVPRCTRAVVAAGRASLPRGRVYGEYTAMRTAFHTQAAVLQEVPVPNMGDSITDGTLSVIEVAPGTHVNVDDVVAVLETDKVSFEVRTPHAGTVAEFFAAEGDTVTVGAPLFRIEEGEAPQAAKEAAPAAEEGANGGTVAAMEDRVVEVPNLGDSIVDGTLATVAAPTGSSVNTDDVVAVIDTDKVSFDVRAPASGTILEFFAQEDDTVQVGAPLFKMSQVAGGVAQPKDAAAASDAAASANGATAGSTASQPQSHGQRVPSIRFRHGKRDAEPSPSSAPSAASSSAPARGVTSTRGSGTSAVTVEDVAFEDLPPMFGRPPMRDFEFDLIESGGAEAWN